MHSTRPRCMRAHRLFKSSRSTLPAGDFSLLPSNARLQTGTPPPGTSELFHLDLGQFLNALTVYKFHVDWDRISLSTFTGPDTPHGRNKLAERQRCQTRRPWEANLLDVLANPCNDAEPVHAKSAGLNRCGPPHTVRRGRYHRVCCATLVSG